MRIRDFKLATAGMPMSRSLWMSRDHAVPCPLTTVQVIDDHKLGLTNLVSATRPLTIADLIGYPDQVTFFLLPPKGGHQPVFGYRVVTKGLLLE